MPNRLVLPQELTIYTVGELRNSWLSWLSEHADENRVPVELVHKVIRRESRYQPRVVGGLGPVHAQHHQAVDGPLEVVDPLEVCRGDGDGHALGLGGGVVEADQVTTPDLWALGVNAVDGIVFDDAGNPAEYHILKGHPGDNRTGYLGLEYDRVPAESVIHYFRADRPGQSNQTVAISPTQ